MNTIASSNWWTVAFHQFPNQSFQFVYLLPFGFMLLSNIFKPSKSTRQYEEDIIPLRACWYEKRTRNELKANRLETIIWHIIQTHLDSARSRREMNGYQHHPVVRYSVNFKFKKMILSEKSVTNNYFWRQCSFTPSHCIIGMLLLMDMSHLVFNCLHLWVCPNGVKSLNFKMII